MKKSKNTTIFNSSILLLIPLMGYLSMSVSCAKYSETSAICSILGEDCKDSVKAYVNNVNMIWHLTPWNSLYTYNEFLNYVLPPVSSFEPVSFHWIREIPYKPDKEYTDVKDAAIAINAQIKLFPQPNGHDPQKSYDEIMLYKRGKCDDRANLCVYAMRANGIPASYDFIPVWGDGQSGHSFCSVHLPDGKNMIFHDFDGYGEQYFPGKVTKIYRKSFFPQKSSSAGLVFPFNDPSIIDVTQFYNVGVEDISITVNNQNYSSIYLSVFTPAGWEPVAISNNYHGSVVFKNIGCGESLYTSNKDIGEDIGEGILYLPSIISSERIVGISYPLVLSSSGVSAIIPDDEHKTSVTLYRKYPIRARVRQFSESLIGSTIEGSDDFDFKNVDIIGKVFQSPDTHPQTIPLSTDKSYRYIRIKLPVTKCALSEFYCIGSKGERLEGRIIADARSNGNYEDKSIIVDSDCLSYIDFHWTGEKWIGYDLGRPQHISSILLCPRTDNNDVNPGDLYELLYWGNDDWHSIERKKALDYMISFDNVPSNSLLLLKDLSSGQEVRPFMYVNGSQIWY